MRLLGLGRVRGRPRRWAAPAASGGRPTGRRLAVARVDNVAGRHLVRRRRRQPRRRRRRRCATRRRGPPTRTSRLHVLDPAGRAAGGGRLGPGGVPVPGRRRLVGAATADPDRAVPRPAPPAGARGRPGRRRDHRALAPRQDPDAGSSWSPGAPRWWAGRLVVLVDRDGARRVVVDGEPLTPPTLQVRGHRGRAGRRPRRRRLGGPDRDPPASASPPAAELHRLTASPACTAARSAGDVLVTASTSMDVGRHPPRGRGAGVEAVGRDRARSPRGPVCAPRAASGCWASAGCRPSCCRRARRRTCRTARCPCCSTPTAGPTPSGWCGPATRYLTSQWFADQGFAVVVVDGRGTPGRGPEWERAVWGDLAAPVLEDQVDALLALAERDERARPVAGSASGAGRSAATWRRWPCCAAPTCSTPPWPGRPVTDWRLYDTHYTERYLGDPGRAPRALRAHAACSTDAERARPGPLLLIHGLADDNVVAAHTLQLSSALLAAGRPHQVLPLSGVTHMTPQEVVAENLLAPPGRLPARARWAELVPRAAPPGPRHRPAHT